MMIELYGERLGQQWKEYIRSVYNAVIGPPRYRHQLTTARYMMVHAI